jgi:hypothetical protein
MNRKAVTGDDGWRAIHEGGRHDHRSGAGVFGADVRAGIRLCRTGDGAGLHPQGIDVACDDGRRGILSGDAIIWADGSRSSLTSPHPGIIIGNKSSVIVGPEVFVGKGNGVVPMDNPSAPNKARCPILDGVAYCY